MFGEHPRYMCFPSSLFPRRFAHPFNIYGAVG